MFLGRQRNSLRRFPKTHESLDRRRVGVVLGNIALPTETSSRLARDLLGAVFEHRLRGEGRAPESAVHPLNRHVAALPAGCVAQALGLGGGSYTLDAACASSLYALKLAADELFSGRADAMLAGGLSCPDSLYTQMGFAQLRALSPTGRPPAQLWKEDENIVDPDDDETP